MAGLLQILNCNLIEQPTVDESCQNQEYKLFIFLYDLRINPIKNNFYEKSC